MINLDWLYTYWVSFYQLYLRRMVKYLMHYITGKCELLRIVYSADSPANRIKRIEKCLVRSRTARIKQLAIDYNYNVEHAVKDIVEQKGIITDNYIEFDEKFTQCLLRISAYNQLLEMVESHRKTAYNSNLQQHEDMLMQLWECMQPGTDLTNRYSEQWTDIGFQGNDPATDFRGMGLLGLEQLVHFASEDPDKCRQVLSKSQHPTKGYSYAIVGINLTSMLYHLLKKRKLRSHFYNVPLQQVNLTEFNRLYCYIFYEFDKYWTKKDPPSIMEFSTIREKFQRKVIARLKVIDKPLDYTESITGD